MSGGVIYFFSHASRPLEFVRYPGPSQGLGVASARAVCSAQEARTSGVLKDETMASSKGTVREVAQILKD